MKSVSTKLPTKYGEFIITVHHAEKGLEPVVLATPEIDITKPVLVRIHDECMTGDTFGSFRCDCGDQKEESLKMITESKNGIFIYMRQEGRGIGLYEKIKAYKLQDEGLDTHEANISLGHKPDERDYLIAAEILKNLGIKQIHLITNNPSKITEISKLGIEVIKRISIITEINTHNQKYIKTKEIKFKHSMNGEESDYFVGINGVENSSQVDDIAKFVNEIKKEPAIKIYVSNDTLDLHSLSDEKSLITTKQVYGATEKFTDLVFVLHYSFRHSSEPLEDLQIIKMKLPFIKFIQLDDLKKDTLDVLKFATDNYSVIFPIQDSEIDQLLSDKDFISIVLNKKVSILLDNSLGKGVRESTDKYKEKVLKLLNANINNIGLAGGFAPDYLDTYFEMLGYFKINISIDAASGLQTNDKFDVVKAKKYIENVLAQKYL